MGWSWKIGRVAGVDIYLHWTFLLLLGWVFFAYLVAGKGMVAAWMGIAFILSLFGCVVLHELGHAMAARLFGVATRDITILPIGGVARLGRIPENAFQEFVIAAAGPIVNVIIAGVLAIVLAGLGGLTEPWSPAVLTGNLPQDLLRANVALVVFNLIPAFPMDGGRMLRALLASFLAYTTATRIAAGVGQGLAILFAIVGLLVLHDPILVFIAMFVYLAASSEAQMVEVRSLMRGILVRDAMMTRFQTLSPGNSLDEAAAELLAGGQQDFPVVQQDHLVGMLRRADLAEGLRAASHEGLVGDAMTRQCAVVSEDDQLDTAIREMQHSSCTVLPVMRGERLIGLIDKENIGELLMIRSALGEDRRVREPEKIVAA